MSEWEASIGFATRGCPNRCKFCEVPKLEAECDIDEHRPLKNIIDDTKKDLLLMDNNILASKSFPKIINEIKKYSFYRGAKFKGRKRYVDFNQGVDAYFLTVEEKLAMFSDFFVWNNGRIKIYNGDKWCIDKSLGGYGARSLEGYGFKKDKFKGIVERVKKDTNKKDIKMLDVGGLMGEACYDAERLCDG